MTRMADLIVNSAVKESLDDINVVADLYEVRDNEAAELLEGAAHRAEANDRKTVQPRDLNWSRVQASYNYSARSVWPTN